MKLFFQCIALSRRKLRTQPIKFELVAVGCKLQCYRLHCSLQGADAGRQQISLEQTTVILMRDQNQIKFVNVK